MVPRPAACWLIQVSRSNQRDEVFAARGPVILTGSADAVRSGCAQDFAAEGLETWLITQRIVGRVDANPQNAKATRFEGGIDPLHGPFPVAEAKPQAGQHGRSDSGPGIVFHFASDPDGFVALDCAHEPITCEMAFNQQVGQSGAVADVDLVITGNFTSAPFSIAVVGSTAAPEPAS